LIPPQNDSGNWEVQYDWQSQKSGQEPQSVSGSALQNGKIDLTIDVDNKTTPGVRGKLRLVISKWNA
jgi:hypothetical protein